MGYFVEKPTPLSAYNEGNGTVLLYPVYDWLAVPGAASYELEILDGPPENPNGISPSEHRIDVYHPQYAQQYDQKARYGPHPFYWRVRALDSAGNPVGVYSDAQPFVTNPDADYEVATYGDSISHGGGSVSYSPTDWDFSYQHYLDFPSVNLAESGNTSTMTRERFEKDVLPFHPRYLIILMGSNSLRNGEGASIVMKDMEAVRQKCLENGIRPVFLTVPPVNPANIKKSFDSETADDWQFQFGRVNAYVRSHVHIDITPGMYDEKGELRTELALDGLHLDPAGKQLMAAAINEAWPEITSLPDSAWEE
jgi:lysophospholipase L1-like esterase